MNFGTIKEQVEIDIGSTIPASTMGRWVNSAQIEIAKRYGSRVRMWYPPAIATLDGDIEPGDTELRLINAIALPEPPNTVMIGDGGLSETITYETADHIFAHDVTRGAQGTTALGWPSGTEVRRLPAAQVEYDLPADLLTLHEVRDGSNKPIFKRVVTPDNKITVLEQGMYYINYTKVPDPIDHTDLESLVVVHPVFHNDIIIFCLARYWQSIAEAIPGEENKAQILMSEFTRSVEMSAKHLKRNENQQLTIGYELWD